MILVVKNITRKLKDAELEHLFTSYGEVVETNIVYDTITWDAKGFAFVEMKNTCDAMDAMEHLNGMQLNGKTLVVKKAHVHHARH